MRDVEERCGGASVIVFGDCTGVSESLESEGERTWTCFVRQRHRKAAKGYHLASVSYMKVVERCASELRGVQRGLAGMKELTSSVLADLRFERTGEGRRTALIARSVRRGARELMPTEWTSVVDSVDTGTSLAVLNHFHLAGWQLLRVEGVSCVSPRKLWSTLLEKR